MKKLSLVLTAMLFAMFIFTSCQKDNNFDKNSLPSTFKVDIPDAISSSDAQKSAKVDQLGGDEIYQQLRLFIAVGEGAADIVQEIIWGIATYDLDKAMSFSFTSDDDGRVKNIEVVENVQYNGKNWLYQLTMTDALDEGGDHNGIGMQIFWNNNPVDGIAILYPYNVNRSDTAEAWSKGMFQIEYSETGEYGYEKSMIVSVADLPLLGVDEYEMSSLKMFVGKNGDVVDVYGNSAHPNATLFNGGNGFDWAFVASGNEISDYAVAEVGLPAYNLDQSSREILLKENSIHNVFSTLISDWYLEENGSEIDSLTLAAYLENAQAPGFFNKDGFIGSGTAPTSDFDVLISNIDALSPYNPLSIANLSIVFKDELAK